jgi:hypothetical protein
VNWKTPDPIQGFDRWEPAALFWIGTNGDGSREVVEGPNHDRLIVKNVGGRESRSYLEFDLDALPEKFDLITLNMVIGNSDPGPPVEVFDFYRYTGDGLEDVEDWDVGEYFSTYDNPHPVNEGRQGLKLDVTDSVRRYQEEGRRYLGFRLSAPRFARFSIGKTGGVDVPNPFLAVHHPEARTNFADFIGPGEMVSFEKCMTGGYGNFAFCTVLWDYNDDEFVDLADFAVFQSMFEE